MLLLLLLVKLVCSFLHPSSYSKSSFDFGFGSFHFITNSYKTNRKNKYMYGCEWMNTYHICILLSVYRVVWIKICKTWISRYLQLWVSASFFKNIFISFLSKRVFPILNAWNACILQTILRWIEYPCLHFGGMVGFYTVWDVEGLRRGFCNG